MANLTPQQLQQDAINAGFTGTGLANIVAISQAEDTSGNPLATNTIGNSAGVDRGILQINSYYHPEVSDSCAFDPQCAFNAAFSISSGGTDFTQWATFDSNKYLQFLGNTGNAAPATGTPTTTTSLTSANVQSFLIQALFIGGGLAIIIMGFILVFKPHGKKLPV